MAFYGYSGDVGECHWTPYSTSYEFSAVLPPQSPLTYSSYEFNEPRLITEYGPYSYFDSYYTTQPVQNYSAYNLSEPKFIQYEPPPSYPVGSFHSQTNYTISYSNLEPNLPEFDEYDPTPYDGGYDPVETYGKPLPPSDEICYPHSSLQPKPNDELLAGFSYGSLPSAYGEKNEQSTKTDNDSKPTATKEQASYDADGEKIAKGTDNGENESPKKPLEEDRGDVDEHPSSSDYGRIGGYGSYIPYGSGLESVDLCESIFGYWPCLTKIEQQRKIKCRVCDDEESRYDPWKSTADYLFGSPFVYGEPHNRHNGS